MILDIDTTHQQIVTTSLCETNGKLIQRRTEKNEFGSQVMLPLIDELIRKNGKTVHEIEAVTVNPKAGSYTGTRVGVAIAMAIGYGLGVPVNDRHLPTQIVEPIYEGS